MNKETVSQKILRFFSPEPRNYYYKQFGTFEHLSAEHIKEIIDLLDHEFEVTEIKFGHHINDEDKLKEQLFFLVTINTLGGPAMTDTYDQNNTMRMVREEMASVFSNESLKYRATPSTTNGTYSNAWYECHMDTACGTLLNMIYSKMIVTK